MERRRVKVYGVPEREVFEMLGQRWRDLDRDVLFLYSPECVPVDAEVVSVRHDPMRRAFLFLISHPSFDEVADGDLPPEAGRLGVETLTVAIDRSDGMTLVRGYRQLLEENERLRGIFGDLRQDDAAIEAAYMQGWHDAKLDSNPVRLVFETPQETEESRRGREMLRRHVDRLIEEYHMRNPAPIVRAIDMHWTDTR